MRILHDSSQKPLVFFALLLFSINGLFSQTLSTDSLSEQIKLTKGTKQIELLNLLAQEIMLQNPEYAEQLAVESCRLSDSLNKPLLKMMSSSLLGKIYIEIGRTEEAKEFFFKSLALARDLENNQYIVSNILGISTCYSKKSEVDSAMYWLSLAKEEDISFNDSTTLALIYNAEACIKHIEGDLLNAIDLYLKAAKYYSNSKNQNKLAGIYNNIGLIYMKAGNFDNALKYLILSSQINEKLQRLVKLNANYSNLGLLYKEADSLEKAKEYYLKSLDLSRRLKTELGMARVFMNLGNLMKKLEQYNSAELHFDSSYFYCAKNNHAYGMLLNKINLGGLYTAQGKYDKAILKLRDCEVDIRNYDLPEEKKELSLMLSEAYVKKGNFKEALYYYKKYIEIRDSISGVEIEKTILQLQTEYESEKKARKIVTLQNEILSIESGREKFYIGLLIFIIIFLSAGFYLFLQRRKSLYQHQLTVNQYEEQKRTIDLRNKELAAKTIQFARLNETILEVDNKMKILMPLLGKKSAEMLVQIEKNLLSAASNKAWEEFETRFEQVHQGFFDTLFERCPDLTPAELKICSFLKLNLTTKDIAMLTCRSHSTIDNARSSIRKKLKLESDTNLTNYLLSI